jgi:hypothetical protein
MIEAGAPNTRRKSQECLVPARCTRPTGGSHVLTTHDLAQRFKGAKAKAAPREREKSATKGIIEAEITVI